MGVAPCPSASASCPMSSEQPAWKTLSRGGLLADFNHLTLIMYVYQHLLLIPLITHFTPHSFHSSHVSLISLLTHFTPRSSHSSLISLLTHLTPCSSHSSLIPDLTHLTLSLLTPRSLQVLHCHPPCHHPTDLPPLSSPPSLPSPPSEGAGELPGGGATLGH